MLWKEGSELSANHNQDQNSFDKCPILSWNILLKELIQHAFYANCYQDYRRINNTCIQWAGLNRRLPLQSSHCQRDAQWPIHLDVAISISIVAHFVLTMRCLEPHRTIHSYYRHKASRADFPWALDIFIWECRNVHVYGIHVWSKLRNRTRR